MSKHHKHTRFYIPWFSAWQDYTPVIPKMYWDVESAEQRMHAVCAQLHKLVCFADFLGEKVDINTRDIEELQTLFEQFMESGFEDYYEKQIEKWIEDHAALLFTKLAKMVFFGLTMDGHFVAYIPDGWEDIVFDTGMVYGRSDYGRLILKFDSVENAVDNTYSYSLAQNQNVAQLVTDLEVDARRTDACFDTLFTNLDEEVVLNGNI